MEGRRECAVRAEQEDCVARHVCEQEGMEPNVACDHASHDTRNPKVIHHTNQLVTCESNSNAYQMRDGKETPKPRRLADRPVDQSFRT